MEIINTVQAAPQSACSLALGTFDGLHRGHLAVVGAALAGANAAGWEPAVFTFRRSPSGERLVMTGQDKARLLEELGVARMYEMDFAAVKDLPAEDFVRDMLFTRQNVRQVCCGEDFRFGRGAAGDKSLLARLCGEAGVKLTVVPPVTENGEKISSTRIRQALEQGDPAAANRLLGRRFGFELEVIHGNHIGSTRLGTPTINQALPEELVCPRFGVYAAWCQVGDSWQYGVCNIGLKPTVGSDRVLAETWMPEFSGDLYGQQVRVCLLDFIRPEKRFDSLEALREEILRNGETARAIAGKMPPAPWNRLTAAAVEDCGQRP